MADDLNMMSTAEGIVPAPLMFDNTRCSGAVKLAQRAMILLFKNRSAATWSALGTDFGNLVKGANMPRMTDLENRCAMAANAVMESIKTYQDQAGTIDPAERISSVKVTVASPGATTAQVTVAVTSEAGVTVSTVA